MVPPCLCRSGYAQAGLNFLQAARPSGLSVRSVSFDFFTPIKRHLVKRKSYPVRGNRVFFKYLQVERDMLSDKARGHHLHHCRIFYRFGFTASNALLYHTPIRIKVFDFHRTGESEQRIRVPRDLRSLFSARFHQSPLSATADPENDRFQAVSKARDSSHGYGCQ